MTRCWKTELDKVLRSWRGVKFCANGRTRAGVDCVGFIFGVLNELQGTAHNVPLSPSHDGRAMVEAAIRLGDLFEHDDATGCEPEAGDVIVVRNWMNTPAHVAIIGGDGVKAWHAVKNVGVCFTGVKQFEVMRIYRAQEKAQWHLQSRSQ